MAQVLIGKGSVVVWLWYAVPALLLLWTAAAPHAYAQFRAGDRVLEPVDSSRRSVMRGSLRPAARAQFDRGELDPATRLGRVTMFFSRTSQQEAELQTLLDEQQDRTSANYHRWLLPEEFADRFGLTQGDLDKIVAWLQAQGLTIQQVSRSRTWVAFSGSARQVEAALRTDLRRYAVHGQRHFAASREPSLPSAFANVVLGFRGLDNFRLKPRARKLHPSFTSFASGTERHFLAPDDLATIYNLKPLHTSGISGSGQRIAVVGQSAINLDDVRQFRSVSGLPANDPLIVPVQPLPPEDPLPTEGDIDEANLDVDWAGAVAPNATILYVYSENVLDAFVQVIDDPDPSNPIDASVLSISYGLCEGGADGFTSNDADILASAAQQGNAKGITIVAPSGDSGAADCDFNASVAEQGLSVDLPGALPYVTSVGGTQFNEGAGVYWSAVNNASNGSALSYIPETTWNETNSSGLAATGGGSSIYFAKPSWQTGVGVPADGARDVPDLSFSASADHDGYLVCSRDATTNLPTCMNDYRDAGGFLTVFGGTSAGVPVFAGVVALLNQVSGGPQGNMNPRLYALAASSPSSFHDVTTGDNKVPFQPSTLSDCTPADTVPIGYSAGTGYDLVTGLGSINAHSFVITWTSVVAFPAGPDVTADFQMSLSPSALTVQRGACGTTQLNLTRLNGFAGTPTFTCSAAAPLTAVTCSVSPVASASVVLPPGFRILPWWMLAVLAFVVCGSLALASKTLRARPVPAFALAGLLALIIGCSSSGDSDSPGGGNPSSPSPVSNYVFTVDAPASAPAGTGTVTVTGAIGGVTRTVQLPLTVN